MTNFPMGLKVCVFARPGSEPRFGLVVEEVTPTNARIFIPGARNETLTLPHGIRSGPYFEISDSEIKAASMQLAMLATLRFLSKEHPTEADRQALFELTAAVFDGESEALARYLKYTGRTLKEDE